MAEEEKSGAAQNSLGQLFVQLGFKGLPNMMKGLNGLSAQFLLTKNAALQAIKPIVNMSMNAANTVTGWEKLNAVMGLSLQQIQGISRFTKLNNIDFNSYMGQLKNVQQKIIDIRTGMSNDVQGFALLDRNPRDFDPQKPLELLEAVKEKVVTLDTVTAAAVLRWFGLSEDLLYVWKQQNTNFDERLNLSDEELEKLKEQQKAWNSLKVTWEAAQQKFIANQTWINKLINETGRLITDMVNEHFDWEYGGEESGFYKVLAKIGQAISDIKVNILSPTAVDIPTQLITAYNNGDKDVFKRYENLKKQNNEFFEKEKEKFLNNKNVKENTKNQITNVTGATPLNEETKNQITNVTGATPLNEETKAAGLPPLPEVEPSKPTQFLPSNTTKEVQYTVIQDINQYIQGNDSQQIANDVSNSLQDATNTSIYNQNLPTI